jgi:hypothetical protein
MGRDARACQPNLVIGLINIIEAGCREAPSGREGRPAIQLLATPNFATGPCNRDEF